MSSSAASGSHTNTIGSLTLRVLDAETTAENGRKFTKYKVVVNYNGQEWEIWRRYKEFHTLNEKVNKNYLFSIKYRYFFFQLASSNTF